MAFFVSKDLEGRVDENSLLEDTHSENIMKEFVFQVEKVVCQILEVNFINDSELGISSVELECECNIHSIDHLIVTDLSGKIFFKNNTIEVSDLKIIKILKKDSDIYIIRLNGYIPRGNKINV